MRRVIAVVALIALSSCAGGSDVAGDRRTVGDVTVAFTITPARVEVGKAVRFALRLTNHGGRPEVLKFASGQLYDFWVTRGDDEEWRWSDDMSFSQATEERSIASQDSTAFEESWTATETGEHIAHALLKADGFERELTGRFDVGG